MILTVPGALGEAVERDIPDARLAASFWASSWGQRARLEDQEPTVALITYLTAARRLGGLQATWGDHTGLHTLRDLVTGGPPGG